jgi:hypothetical protein
MKIGANQPTSDAFKIHQMQRAIAWRAKHIARILQSEDDPDHLSRAVLDLINLIRELPGKVIALIHLHNK